MGKTDNRKIAYSYMIHVVQKQLNWIPPIDSDIRLADALDIPVSELDSLKKGISDPSDKMVKEFKKLVCPLTSEREVENYLVIPFLRSS